MGKLYPYDGRGGYETMQVLVLEVYDKESAERED